MALFLFLPFAKTPQEFNQNIELGGDCPIACDIAVIMPVHNIFETVPGAIDSVGTTFIA